MTTPQVYSDEKPMPFSVMEKKRDGESDSVMFVDASNQIEMEEKKEVEVEKKEEEEEEEEEEKKEEKKEEEEEEEVE